MSVQVNRIDANGFYVEPIVLEDGEVLTEAVTDADGNVTYQPRADIITVSVPEGFHHPKWDGTQWVEGKTDAELLQIAKDAKYIELQALEAENLKLFQSSALGTPHTYVRISGNQDFSELFNGQFSYVNSPLFTGTTVDWYTIESGNTNHTKDQFNTVYVDGLNHVSITKFHRASLEAQVSAATTVADVNAVVW